MVRTLSVPFYMKYSKKFKAIRASYKPLLTKAANKARNGCNVSAVKLLELMAAENKELTKLGYWYDSKNERWTMK